MTRWMALDVGLKTIGIAVTDPLRIMARPLTTLARRDVVSDARALSRLIREQEVDKLIVGRPRHLDGTPSETVGLIEPLVRHLEELTTVAMEWVDERLSTKEAEELMREAGLSLPEQQRRRDEFAAAVILRRYLEELP